MRFRRGQWVKGRLPSHIADKLVDAHRVAGDYYVGICHPAHRQRAVVSVQKGGDGEEKPKEPVDTFEFIPETITLCRPDGSNAMFLAAGVITDAKFNPDQFRGELLPCETKDIPPGRVVREGFECRP